MDVFPKARFFIFVLVFLTGVAGIRPMSWATGAPDSTDQLQGDPFADDSAFSLAFDESPPTEEKARAGMEMHGYLESRNRLRFHDADFISLRQRLWMEVQGGCGQVESAGAPWPLRAFISGAVDVDSAAADLSSDHEDLRGYLEEAFFTIDRPGWNGVVGRKIHRMGTGDGINPLDLINPLDHRDPFATGSSDARLPVLMGLFTINLPVSKIFQEVNLDMVFVPLAEVNQLYALGSAWEPPALKTLRRGHQSGQYILEAQEEPDQYFDQSEVQVRIGATLSGWDLSVIGFYGYLDSPVFKREYRSGIGGGAKLHVTPVHPSFFALGVAFAKGLERSTLRGELAMKPDLPVNTEEGALPGVARTMVMEGVLGMDRTFGTNFYVSLQYFGTWTRDADDLTRDTWAHGMTYNIHDSFLRDALEIGGRGIWGFSGQGLTLEAYAEYQFADNWLFQGSVFCFEGANSGTYGQYDDNDMVTLRVRYSF